MMIWVNQWNYEQNRFVYYRMTVHEAMYRDPRPEDVPEPIAPAAPEETSTSRTNDQEMKGTRNKFHERETVVNVLHQLRP